MQFSSQQSPIRVLLPDASISFFVDIPRDFVKKYGDTVFTGVVHFSDGLGKRDSHQFAISAADFKESLTYDNETVKTHVELQKLPSALDKIRQEIERIGRPKGGLDPLDPSDPESTS